VTEGSGAPADERPEVPILYLDDDVVVVAKPAHMSVHRGPHSGPEEHFVLQTVRDQILRHLYPVHRLDRQTSGVLAFGLSKKAAGQLQENLRADEAEKTYLTLARGETDEEFVSERELTDERGVYQPAHTEFRRRATFSRCSLLEARLRTGRTHQIRRHLDHLAHQVIGDRHHGKGRINNWFREHYGLPRMFLHAWRLSVRLPGEDALTTFRAPLPEDLRGFLERLPDVPAGTLEALDLESCT